MNAFMQCLAPIDLMRDHYLSQVYSSYKDISTKRESFDFCNSIYLFYKATFRLDDSIIDLDMLKKTVAKKFHPI